MIRPEPTPIRRYFLLIVLVAMAMSASYLLLKGVGSKGTAERLMGEQRRAEAPAAPSEPSQEDVQRSIADRVRAHIAVPSGENPAMWTVSSADLVRQQNPVLFQDAEVGDYVLAWNDRIVVYSASKDRVIGMLMTSAPVEAPSGEADTASMAEAEERREPATIEIRNASGIAGAARRLKESVVKQGLTVTSVSDAAIRRTGTLIVDQTGGQAESEIAIVLGAASGTVVTAMPEGEPASEAGVLVLIGR